MKPAISQVCSLPFPFETDIEDYAAGHCSAIDVWLTKLETYLETHSLQHVQQLWESHRIAVPVASFQGGILASQGEARREAWQLLERRLELCRQLAIETLVISGDIPGPITATTIDRVHASLGQAAQLAADRQVRLALEFQATAAYINNLQTAVAVLEEVNHPALGLCLDVFHFYVGPSKLSDLGYLSGERLFHVQVSDLADTPREFATDSHRILPGDGDIPLEPIVDHLRQIDYSGYVSLEVMNPQLWQVPPRQFGEIGMTALRALLRQASMG
jgi:2-keto-myo-inositol isomerase